DLGGRVVRVGRVRDVLAGDGDEPGLGSDRDVLDIGGDGGRGVVGLLARRGLTGGGGGGSVAGLGGGGGGVVALALLSNVAGLNADRGLRAGHAHRAGLDGGRGVTARLLHLVRLGGVGDVNRERARQSVRGAELVERVGQIVVGLQAPVRVVRDPPVPHRRRAGVLPGQADPVVGALGEGDP